jgi:hypothetical protein
LWQDSFEEKQQLLIQANQHKVRIEQLSEELEEISTQTHQALNKVPLPPTSLSTQSYTLGE